MIQYGFALNTYSTFCTYIHSCTVRISGAVLGLHVDVDRRLHTDSERFVRRGARRVPRDQSDPRGNAVARRAAVPAGERLVSDGWLEGGSELVFA